MADSAAQNDRYVDAMHSQQVNASAFRRYLTLFTLKLLRRSQERRSKVLFASDKICIKYGRTATLNEASALQFIAKHTSIPVPRVYCAFIHQHRTYIVMERMRGEPVARGWTRRSEESKAKILDQLKKMVEEMRRISPPEDVGVASVNGGPLYDVRLPGTAFYFGPFKTVQDFHKFLRNDLKAHPGLSADVNELISRQENTSSGLVFTHGDLSSFNILASGDEVVGIIDWETAGWYPSYWEYTNAWNVYPFNGFWQEEVDKFLEPMPEELAMEKIRLRYFGDVT
ncbi:kinase-like protein [Curvularia clavata]|uniref:Kinase-like protein n=1 Tax=Curvularia clavata TaxID=95742 RepID=A0A9Q9DW56_CURCL|nr:kinase-like protein [Curvularia clavata]